MQETKRLPIRLAIRRQGNDVVAYLAKGDTMDGAIEMGRIAHFIVENNDARFHSWKNMMVAVLAEGVEMVSGEAPTFVTEPAPESERSGHA